MRNSIADFKCVVVRLSPSQTIPSTSLDGHSHSVKANLSDGREKRCGYVPCTLRIHSGVQEAPRKSPLTVQVDQENVSYRGYGS
jgi:hypothetical protein